MTDRTLDQLAWSKGDGLLPAVVQHWLTGTVLMLGYMNEDAMQQTTATGKVTFWSRSKQRLWTKGETSGNFLMFKSMQADCDGDAILIQAEPQGPTCHLGTASCFGATAPLPLAFIAELDELIGKRQIERAPGSYTSELFARGVRGIAQKVGEEAVETALAAVAQDDAALLGEAADLIYHLLALLRARGLDLAAVAQTLRVRHRPNGQT